MLNKFFIQNLLLYQKKFVPLHPQKWLQRWSRSSAG